MTQDPTEEQPSGQRVNFPAWVLWSAAILFLAIAGIYAYTVTFSQFAAYDDEGYLMITVRGYLEGQPLYDGVFTGYGPVYYFYEWVIHALVGLPLTHDTTRFLCVVHWIATGALLAFAASRVTRSPLLGFFVFMQSTVHLTALIGEPGHPQELVTMLLALATLIATRGLEKRWTLTWLGGIGACLALTKINVGAFYGFALLMAVACHTPVLLSRRTLFTAALALSGTLPFLLMRQHLVYPWARDYAWLICVPVLAAGMFAYGFGTKQPATFTKWCEAGIGFAATLALFTIILLLTGTSLRAMIDSLVLGPAKLAGKFCLPFGVPYSAWSATAALCVAAVVVALRNRLANLRFAIIALKAIYGILGTFVLNEYGRMGLLLPWVWLVLLPVPKEPGAEIPKAFFRTFVCLAAAWQGLQAYPVAGSQVSVGSLLVVLVCSVCLHDAITAAATESSSATSLRSLLPRTVLLFKYLAFAGLLFLFGGQWCPPFRCWKIHAELPALDLPGARHVRLPAAYLEAYHPLTDYLRTHCDTFVTYPGFNSLHFWTGKFPPTHFNASEVMLLSEHDQGQVVAALKKAKRPLIVLSDQRLPFVAESEVLGDGPLSRFIHDDCREVKRVGHFRILAPKVTAPETDTASSHSFL
jgi:hypothetical protein